MPLSDALPVVKPSFGYVLLDGHHTFIVNLRYNGTQIPIKIIKNLSHLSEDNFMKQAQKEGYIYPYDVHGKIKPLPKSFSLINDPNRFFAFLGLLRAGK